MYRSLILVKSTGEMHDLATPPLWYQYEDPQDVIVKVYKFLTDMNFFENLDAFADHAIHRGEAEARHRPKGLLVDGVASVDLGYVDIG